MTTQDYIYIASLAVYITSSIISGRRNHTAVKTSINSALLQNRTVLSKLLSDIVNDAKNTSIVHDVENEALDIVEGTAHAQAGTNG